MNESSLPALNGQGIGKLDMSSLKAEDLGGGNSRKYTIAKLKRDAPEHVCKASKYRLICAR